MNRFRMAATAVLLTCAVSLGAASTAAAQEPAATPFTKRVELTGTKGFKGTYTIKRFTTRAGEIVAVGKLTGKMRKGGKTRRVSRNNVRMPAELVGAGSGASASQVLPPIDDACEVLNLVLGPITLDLLGLVVRTNLINVRIDAVPGEGNLLGNLLCGITGILNPTGALGQLTGAIRDLTAALNAILALVPRTA
jgi:hypothetical protein